jgi:hypothetical protein
LTVLPAYLVFGRSKFAGMKDAFPRNRQEIDVLARQIRPTAADANVSAAIDPGQFHERE